MTYTVTLTEEERYFVHAHRVLRELKKAGCHLPSIQLFSDGSGSLHLGPVSSFTRKQKEKAKALIRSVRASPYSTEDDYILDFFHGLHEGIKSD